MSTATLTVEILLEHLRGEGVRRTVTALRKPPVPSRLLQELAERTDVPEALQFVAAYPLAPSHLLESLARTNTDPAVLALLATNPRTPPHLLTEFAAHADPGVRAQAASHPQLAARELQVLARDEALVVRRAVAANPSLRLPHQATLIADAEPSVRLKLAAQPGLPAPVALVLGADLSPVVRTHAVATIKTDEALLLDWAAGDEEDVQLALARREDLPASAWRLLLQSPHASVRRLARAASTPDHIELLNLITRGEPDEIAWVAAQSPLPRALQSLLAQLELPEARVALAGNPSLDADIARYFIGQADETVAAALAVNPALTAELVQELVATRQPAMLAALAYRPQIDAVLARFLLGHSEAFRRHWAIQPRPIDQLDAELAKKLFADPLPTVRALGVSGHAWRRADLYDLARDPAAIVRIAVIHHPNAADELLDDRLADPVPEVATAAREQREKRARTPRVAPVTVTVAPRLQPVAAPAGTTREPLRTTTIFPAETTAASSSFPSDPSSGLLTKLKRIFW